MFGRGFCENGAGGEHMLTKRIIPCLDIKDGRVVKGVQFQGLQDAGDPVSVAKIYNDAGADELVFLDITASYEKRNIILDVVKKTAECIFIPLTVGGGIDSTEQIRKVLLHGADKVSLNSAAVKNPTLITEAAKRFGSQCIVVAIDVKKINNQYKVFIRGGREETDLEALEWGREVQRLGAGEILLTSMDSDGTKDGFDIEITRKMSEELSIPVIASGGAGKLDDFYDVLTHGKADAALAASLFHYGQLTVEEVKAYLNNTHVAVRM